MNGTRGITAALFTAALLAFLLPFGTVSCQGEEVSFTGAELAARQVQPDGAAAGDSAQGLAGDVEAEAGTYVLMALVFAAAGLVSAVCRGRGGGFALASLGSLLMLLLEAATSLADAEIGVGFWLALAGVAGAGLPRLRERWRTRRRRAPGGSPTSGQRGRLRRLVPPVLFAAAAVALVVALEALVTPGGGGS